jgi:ferritin-like metal-binding protein YciE
MEKCIKDLFIDELHDLLSCAVQIVNAYPEAITAAESTDLRDAFEQNLKETKNQIDRLERIFRILNVERREKFCEGTKGLIQECRQVLTEYEKSPVRDAALISKAQRIAHYEISAYGTTRTFAKELGFDDVVDLLQESHDEEVNIDKKLTKIAEGGLLTSGINRLANVSK